MKKCDVSDGALPKSLFKFYTKCVLKGSWKYLILFAFLKLLVGAELIMEPYYDRWIVAMFENAPTGMAIFKHVLPTILMIWIISNLITTVATFKHQVDSFLQPRISRRISELLTDYVHSQSMAFWVHRMSGSINTNIRFCYGGFTVITNNIIDGAVKLITILINSALLFTVNKYIAFVFISVFIFRVAFMWMLQNPIKNSAERSAKSRSNLDGWLIDSFVNNGLVRMFAGKQREHNHLSPLRQENQDAARHAAFIQRIALTIPTYLWYTAFAGTLVLCAYLYGKQMMSLADIVYSVGVYVYVMFAISALIDQIPEIIDGLASANKGYHDLVVPITVVDAPNAPDLKVKHGKIEIKNVSFKYKNKYVLRDLSLTINAGERVGIVGRSGAGKTTLVNLLMRFYDVARGKILIDGVDIRDVRQNSLRENISFIPQEPAMFNRTILENIAYSRPDATMAEIKRAAHSASADKFIMGTEKKYNTMVGDRGIKMSGGQRQRVAIARAFLKDAPILILDEATSALDSETEVAIQNSFEKLSHNRTTIAIAHRLSTLRNMDRIVVLDGGKIVESGTHAALLRRGGEYARLWKMQSGGFLQDDKQDGKKE